MIHTAFADTGFLSNHADAGFSIPMLVEAQKGRIKNFFFSFLFLYP